MLRQVLGSTLLLASSVQGGEVVTAQAPQSLVLSGTCIPSLNGQVFSMQGATASGKPYYVAQAIGAYLYLDPSCDGSSGSRWILDDTQPNVTAANQLNGRGVCAYFADREAPDANSSMLGLGTSTWAMNCDGSWSTLNLTFAEQPQAFKVSDACLPAVNTGFEAAGTTASGVAFYRSKSGDQYIYQDPSCDGVEGARWIIDDVAPNTSKASQLNGLGQCSYFAHEGVIAGSALQMGSASWTMFCDGGWQMVDLTLASAGNATGDSSSTTAMPEDAGKGDNASVSTSSSQNKENATAEATGTSTTDSATSSMASATSASTTAASTTTTSMTTVTSKQSEGGSSTSRWSGEHLSAALGKGSSTLAACVALSLRILGAL